MGNPEALKRLFDEELAVAAADLDVGRTRVRNSCFTCPFHEADPSGARGRSGNPNVLCKHPATWVPPEPLKVEIGEHGSIPHNCPLKVHPLTVFLDPKDAG